MIREHFVRRGAARRLDECGDGLDLLGGVVDAGNDWCADDEIEIRQFLSKLAEIVEDLRIRDAGDSLVLFWVEALDVEEDSVGESSRLIGDASADLADDHNALVDRQRIVALSRPSGETPLQLMVAALHDVHEAAADHQPVAVIFVPDAHSAQVETAVLEKLYSLTGAEAAFVGAFVAERNLEDAARARGIRTSTARGYLKSAFQKTGTHSQHELMHLLLTGVGRIQKP